jgi:signal peptidase
MDNIDFRSKFKKLKDLFLKFWRSEDSKVSLVRDIFVALLLVFIIISALWAYTGQWFGTPMVAIESGSMMHLNEPFGRIGTIDAGDMVLLVKVNSKSDIVTEIERDSNNHHYGMHGDVIVYRPYGDVDRDQIIHRAMCWVEYHEEYDTYTVEDYDLYNVTKINIPALGLNDWTHPKRDLKGKTITPHSGYFTKGDNPNTNDRVDQAAGGICNEPIKLSWVSGKARGELPWIGTLNLLFNDITGGKNTLGNVPGDSLTCLVLLIAVLISIPISLDLYSYYKERKKQQQ